MLTRTLLAVLAAAAVAAGGSTTVLVNASGERGAAQRAPRSVEARQAGGPARAGGDAVAGSATDPAPPACPTGVRNHGAYVSSVAGSRDEAAEPGAHGALVSAAARSDCGKPAGAEAAGDAGDKAARDAAKAARRAAKAAAKAERAAAKDAGPGARGARPSGAGRPGTTSGEARSAR